MKKSNKDNRLPKVAMNIIREISEGKYQVYQAYAGMMIPLLGNRIRGVFVEAPADSINEAHRRLWKEYYE